MATAEEAVAAVRAAVAGRSGTRWVGVDGLGGAGKSTLARLLATEVPGAVVVPVDDFARPGVRPWEWDRFARTVVGPLRAGRPARYQRWPYDSGLGLDWREVQAGAVVVVEGVSATDVRLGIPWALTMWVETPLADRTARILARDGPELLDRWRREWWPSEEVYLREQNPRGRAALVVDGSALPQQW
ncbi:MAG: hypothetical protein ACLGIF_05410 [Actinomycetes bacterium]